MKTVIITGGGASGMAAAFACAEKHHVILIEKNEKLGKKVYITGKGRCNLTNDAPMHEYMKSIVTNPKFLYSAFASYDKDDIQNFMKVWGCPVKTERGQRVFPVSDHASDVIRAFEKALKDRGVEIRYRTEVKSLILKDQVCTGVTTSKGELRGDAVIVCTGGISYPLTGSTGDGYRFAQDCGLAVTDTYPALTSLKTEEAEELGLSGLSLKNISVRFIDPKKPKKPLYADFGELLFTHNGISGPVVLSASSYLTKRLNRGETVQAFIDLKPALDEQTLDARVLRDLSENINRSLKNSLSALLPSSMIPAVIRLSGLDGEKKCHELKKEERLMLLRTLKAFPLTVTGTGGFQEAVVTQGGVSVKEIDPSTMESKKIKNLYFAGEVLDVDALTGGYNLQIAWSTGHLAGSSIE